jgi:hypothetical protein
MSVVIEHSVDGSIHSEFVACHQPQGGIAATGKTHQPPRQASLGCSIDSLRTLGGGVEVVSGAAFGSYKAASSQNLAALKKEN